MTIRYEKYSALPAEPLLTGLVDLLAATFANRTSADIRSDILVTSGYPFFLVQLAFSGDTVVGCKLGYERESILFYSWLGCVDPAYRGMGIAAELMQQQHDWCRAQGYKTIRTQTYNQWRSMLLLNIRSGFDVVGTEPGRYGLKIVLEKTL